MTWWGEWAGSRRRSVVGAITPLTKDHHDAQTVPCRVPRHRRRGGARVRPPRAGIAAEFGISESCLHRWLQLHSVDNGGVDAATGADAGEARELRRRVKVLEEENLIL